MRFRTPLLTCLLTLCACNLQAKSAQEWSNDLKAMIADTSDVIQPRLEEEIRTAEATSLEHLFSALRAVPQTSETHRIGMSLYERWGALDSATAVRHARTETSAARLRYEAHALAGWATIDPEKAWTEALAISVNGADRRIPITVVLYTIAKTDLGRALLYFEELPPDRACMECHAANLCALAIQQNRIDDVLTAIKRLPAGPARSALRDRIWEFIGTTFEEGALLEWQKLPEGQDKDAALVKVYIGWAIANTREALDSVMTRTASDRFETLLLAVLQVWAGSAPAADIRPTLSKLPKDLKERSAVGIVSTLVRTDPKGITQWAASFTHTSLRNEALNSAMYAWCRLEPDAAREFIHGTSDRETRATLVWAYLLGKIYNRTLSVDDLEEINAGFNKPWIVRMLEKMAADLANPGHNDVQFFDLDAFIHFVNTQPQLDEKDREKILSALKAGK